MTTLPKGNRMTGTELATLPDRKEYAVALAGSDLLPKQFRGNPANVLVAIEYGAALGLDPIVAMNEINVIEGKPTASAKMIGGLVRSAGHILRVEGDDTRAVATVIRRDDPDFAFTAVWTIERAHKAGLTGKTNWKHYPAAMLKARAITEVARDACPEALNGVAYTPEELEPVRRGPAVSASRLVPTEAGPVDTGTGEIVEPEPEPEIVDAEIVDDSDSLDEFTRTETDARTEAQSKKVHALLRELGIGNRADGLAMVNDILGDRQIASTKELTKSEASLVIETLTAMQQNTANG